MRIFGLVGYPLDHSWSPAYFARKFALENLQDAVYRLFPIRNPEEIPTLLEKTQGLCGLNVTVPYKVAIMSCLNEVDEIAATVGAVNTITVNRTEDKIFTRGYNTDILGFEKSILPHLEKHHSRALVLGTGGASKAVTFVLKKLGINYTLVSRNPSGADIIGYTDLENLDITSYNILINTTPVGQMADSDCPVSASVLSKITGNHLLFDLIYNPLETKFLKAGKEAGANCVNGMEMLMLQADESWKIWNK